MKDINDKIHYDEIVYLRSVITILIIVSHSFAIYSGAWIKPEWLNISSMQKYYRFINPFFIYAALPSFVLISGYLSKNCNIKCFYFFKIFVIKKFKRLIIPSIMYGILYILFFNPTFTNESITNLIYSIINGVGHLWFLPMLFFIIIIESIFYKIFQLNIAISCSILFLISFIPLPLRLSEALWYLPFFIIGKNLFSNKFKFNKIIMQSKIKIIHILFLYLICFILFQLLKNTLSNEFSILNIKTKYIVTSIIKFILGLVGSISLLAISFILLNKYDIPSKIFKTINYHSFNIYIYHQFFIIYFLYHTKLNTNTHILPFVIFILSLSISLILSIVSKNISSLIKSSTSNIYLTSHAK